ncbi:sensor histidine kinase [Kocuria salina]|uniref:sensor histidine kinase n=1 Tax=Kocuria salina TaxID=1929416 RepID=UPI0015939202|nr:histidine kinase [Kocuria salina]NVC22605.1 sensor histidine kinase [Kocuria salina]
MPSTVAARPSYRPAEEVDPRLVDAVLAAAMAVVVAVVAAADLEGTGRAGALAYLFAAGFGALLLARRHAPRLVLVLTVLGIFVYYMFQLPPIGIALPAVAALFSAAEADRTRTAVAAGLVLVSVAAYFRVEEGLPASYLVSYDLLTDVALVAAAIALGVSVRSRRELRAHEERLRALAAAEERHEAERRLQAEKAGIARDLHDTIGHTMSVIAVHSNVAAEAVGRDDAAAARALEQIRAAASATLRELRSTVKLLRTPDADPAERTSIGLAGLPQLLAAAQDADVEVTARIDVDPAELDTTIDAAAFRILQESLTNVLRHSGARHASVEARLRNGTLDLSVIDDGNGAPPGTGPHLAGGGRGLQGMAERAGLLGGTLTAGNRDGGGFEVRATLPRRLGP